MMRSRKILQRIISATVILLAFVGCGTPTATPMPTSSPAPTLPPVTPTSTFGDWLRVTPTISGANVDVGDYELFISCQGEGSPTVVFEAGWGVHDRWTSVLPATAKLTRACRYNRHFAGVDEEPRTAQQMVDDLHRLLVNAGVEGPYVLVGHSFGGFIARLYAHQYPGDVVGMVLVDSSHENQVSRFQESVSPATWEELQRVDAEVGAVMEAYYPDQENIDFDQSAAQVRATRSLGDMPLAVLTAGRDFAEPPQVPPIVPDDLAEQYLQLWVVVAEPFAKVRLELQTELANLSSNSKHIMAEESGHFIQNDQPDLVIDAIRQVVEAAQR